MRLSRQPRSTRGGTHQEAVEEFVHKEAQHAHQHIGHVVEKGHVQDDRSVPSGERAAIPDETHQKHYFIAKLKGGQKLDFTVSSIPKRT